MTAGKDVVVNLPTTPLAEPFEIVARQDSTQPAEGGLVDRTFVLSVVAWEPGKKTLPPFALQTVAASETREVKTEPIEVEVLGVVGEDDTVDVRPGGISGPVSVYQRDLRLLWGAGALVGLILLWVFARWVKRRLSRRTPKQPVAVVDLRSPHEIALAKLGGLTPPDGGDPRPFYFAMTEIVREYLGRRFGFDALEQTTTELLVSLAAVTGAPDVRDWLEGCDLVKFASLKVSLDDARAALAEARGIVERTIPPPPTPVPPEVRA